MLSGLFGNTGIGQVSAMELNSRLKGGDQFVLLDVREANELSGGVGAINGIVHIPVGTLMNRIKEIELHKHEDIIVICHSGARANTAAKILKQSGFEKVSVLTGGMLGWRREGL